MTTCIATERGRHVVQDLDGAAIRRFQTPDHAPLDDRAGRAFQCSTTNSDGRLLQFIQMMVHDFRHHLSIVYASSELLSMRGRTSLESSDLLVDIRRAVDSIADQLESLLLFARTGHAFSPRHQSLARVIENAVQMVRPHSEMHSVSIHCRIQPKIFGCVDDRRLGSAIFNLILNACQAAEAGAPPGEREVLVALDDGGGDVFVRVTDNGPGVPPEMREDLFRNFMRSGKNREMGLGLAIARCVAQEHGGDAYLELSRPGETTFTLKLRGVAAQS